MSGAASQPTDNEAAVKEFQEAFKKSAASYREPSAFLAAFNAFHNINSLDDRKMALEHVVTFLSGYSDGLLKDRANKFQNKLIELLYDDFSHPPATYIGPKYSYRMPDGSFNNLSDPNMGKAREPYARSVQQTHHLPRNMLPDAGLVFDLLLKREKFIRHPTGLSSMMFSFAALVVHTIFRTSYSDVTVNETSSYLDLAPLYGSDEETLNKIRIRDGRGHLFPDIIAEERLLLLPPAICALIVIFSRNHNYIANRLLEINERSTYTEPDNIPLEDPQRAQKLTLQDEDIFQTARLINCSWFASIVFSDYLRSILGLVRQGSTWTLSIFKEIRDSDHKLFERGRGNACSVEFNCLYRWHATTSEADANWVEQFMSRTFPDRSAEDITLDDFKDAVYRIQAKKPHITQWTFGNLKRGEDGRFNDSELAEIIKNATEHPAAAFGARGTPHVMRLHEIMGIESCRRWGVCSFNEFRKSLGLKPYSSFLEWNSNPAIAEAAENLYTYIDNLELYVGLQAEEVKPVVDGAGLCSGYTISRAILSDIIALTRGDRYFTADYTPFNLTAWGFADSQHDANGPGYGNTLGRLFLRTLPREFSENSTYTWFPFQTPESMKVFLEKLRTGDRYSFDRPGGVAATASACVYDDVLNILRSTLFRPHHGDKASRVVSGEGFFLASNDDAESSRDQREILRVLLGSPGQHEKIAYYFYQRTRRLIIARSFSQSDGTVRFVDIVRDVLRYVPLYWTATELAGLELKRNEKSRGDYTESQLYEMVTDIYSFLFLDVDPSKAMNLEERVKRHVGDLQRRIRARIVPEEGQTLSVTGVVGTIQTWFSAKPKKETQSAAETLFENGTSVDRATNNVLSLLVGASVELSQSIINVVNYYVDKADVVYQLRDSGPKNPALEGYVHESMRIDPPFRGVYRESSVDQIVGSLGFVKGQRVFVDLALSGRDPRVFPDPLTVDIHRESKTLYLTGDGIVRSLGAELTTMIVSQMLRAVFTFDGMRRGPGLSGTLKRHEVTTVNTIRHEYLGADNLPTVWPNTMIFQYDPPSIFEP